MSMNDIKALQASDHGYPALPNTKIPPYMTAEPVLTTCKVKTQDLAVLASDDLWDVMSSETAVE